MITKVTGRTRTSYLNEVNKEISLSLMGYSEYACKPIEGLGPVKSEISTTVLPLEGGGESNSAKDGMRNIVLTVEFKPEYSLDSTVTALRHKLLDVWTPGNEVELDFETAGGKTYRIKGDVESHEPLIFTKDPTVQISILCADPYFRELNEPIVTKNIPINGPPLIVVEFDGNVKWGFDFEVEILEPPANGVITLQQLPQRDANYLSVAYSFLTGDKLKFSTVKGRRLVTLTRGGVTTNVLGYFSGSLTELRMENGKNYFSLANVNYTKNVRFSYEKVYGSL